MRIFSSKRRSERIAIGETCRIRLHIELTAHTQKGRLAKHVLRVVNLLLLQGHWREIELVFILRCLLLCGLLLLLILLLFLSFVSLISGLLFSCLLGCDLSELLLRFWHLQLRLEFCLCDWSIMVRGQDCCDSEHFTSTLTVGCCDNRGMNIEEAARLEKLMRRICQTVSDASHRTKSIGSRPQMLLLPQSLLKRKMN